MQEPQVTVMYAYSKEELEAIMNAVAKLSGTWLESNKVMDMLKSAKTVTVRTIMPEMAAPAEEPTPTPAQEA